MATSDEVEKIMCYMGKMILFRDSTLAAILVITFDHRCYSNFLLAIFFVVLSMLVYAGCSNSG